jgi:hypothetical protein
VLPVFLTSRFLDNPISSNISRTNSLINKGDLLIDKRRLSSKQTPKASSILQSLRHGEVAANLRFLFGTKERTTEIDLIVGDVKSKTVKLSL